MNDVVIDRRLECPLSTASSTCRRNTSIKFLGRGFELQCFAWPSFELSCHFIQMGLRANRQVGSLGKVLPEQAVGVLVGTALPRTLRIVEVHRDVGRRNRTAAFEPKATFVKGASGPVAKTPISTSSKTWKVWIEQSVALSVDGTD